jgi:hypothetical protein
MLRQPPVLEIIVFNDENVVKWKAEYQRLIAWLESDNRRKPALTLAFNNKRDEHKDVIKIAETFLKKLRKHPDTLYNELRMEILQKIKLYNFKYPTNQSLFIRKALFKLHEKLMQNTRFDNISDAQNEYINLCRYLWQIHKQLVTDNRRENYIFHALFITILKSTHIEVDGALPNDLAAYRLEDKIEIMSTAELLEKEDTQYLFQLNELKKRIAFMRQSATTVFTQIRANYANEIVEEIENQYQRSNFDIKFGATVLESTRMLLQRPLDDNQQKSYADLSAHAEGGATTFKKVAGTMLRLLATTLICASLTILISLSAGMLLLPIATTAIITSSTFITGAIAFTYSDKWLANGTRSGFSLKMFKLSELQPVPVNMQHDADVDVSIFRPG